MLILQQKNIRVVFEKQLIKTAFRFGENYGQSHTLTTFTCRPLVLNVDTTLKTKQN